jgi:hypothetical protein
LYYPISTLHNDGVHRMEELKNEVTMLRAERDHLEQRLSVVNKEMVFLQNTSAHSPVQSPPQLYMTMVSTGWRS